MARAFEWVDCWFDRPLWRPMHCGRFHTRPEAGARPEQFSLPVVYIPQWFWRVPDRRCCISPGPGGSSWLGADEVGFWSHWVEQTGWDGGVVLYDQRGVGLSEPALDCPEMRSVRRELLPCRCRPRRPTAAYARRHAPAMTGSGPTAWICIASPPIECVGCDRPDVGDGSGALGRLWCPMAPGSRIADDAHRPEHLRSVVLDSVYPPQVNAELSDAWLLQRAFELPAVSVNWRTNARESPADLDANCRGRSPASTGR